MEKHVGHIISLTFDIHWTKLLASSNFLLRSSSYGIGQRKQERSYDPKNTHQTAQNIGSQRMYIWREKPRVKASTGNLAMTCQDFRCALVNAHRVDTALWDLGENLIPKSKVYVEWPLLVVFVPVAPVGDAAWTLNQHGPTSPWNQSQMQWTSMDPRACNQRTQHPNTMTRSRSQDASSFFLLASWQPENTVNIRAPFTGSTEAVIKSRFLLPMSRWLGGSLSSEEYMYTWKNIPPDRKPCSSACTLCPKMVILPQCRADLMIWKPGKIEARFLALHRHRCNACTVISWQ